MEENVLKDFETFKEFPDNKLKITSNSPYYLIKKSKKSFIARKNIDFISSINILGIDRLITKSSYYNVVDGNLVYQNKSISNIDGSNKEYFDKEEKVKIFLLSEILNISENGVYYISSENINSLIEFKEENAKTYNMKPRKFYF